MLIVLTAALLSADASPVMVQVETQTLRSSHEVQAKSIDTKKQNAARTQTTAVVDAAGHVHLQCEDDHAHAHQVISEPR